MRNLIYFFALLLLIACSKDANELKDISPGLAWKKDLEYGSSISLDAQGIAAATDGGFVFIEDNLLRKHDINGNYSFSSTFFAQKIIAANNGYLVHSVDSSGSKLIALENDFNIRWEKSFETNVHYILATTDGFLITHLIGFNVAISKLSTSGDVVWQKTFDNTNGFRLNSIQAATDGFIATGNAIVDGNENIWVIRLNTSGDVIWEKQHGTSEAGKNIFQLDNGNFLALTASFSILILDDNGDKKRELRFGDTYFKALIRANDGDFIAVGYGDWYKEQFAYPYGVDNCAIAKINQDGERIWQLETSIYEYENNSHAVVQTTDNGYVVLSDAYYGEESLIFKVNPE